MGIALAQAASEYGAEVELVLGPVSINTTGIEADIVNVVTAVQMAKECVSRFKKCDIAILAAAVADFTPVNVASTKIKKGESNLTVELRRTRDIAAELGQMKKHQLIAGFALETDNELDNAKKKLKNKNMDLIVLNSLNEKGAGFEHDTNRITIIDRNNNIDKFELKSKQEAAKDILDKLAGMLK